MTDVTYQRPDSTYFEVGSPPSPPVAPPPAAPIVCVPAPGPDERVENCFDNDASDATALCRSVVDSTDTFIDVEFLGEMQVTAFTIEGADTHLGAFQVLLMDIDGNSVTCYDYTFDAISPYPATIHRMCDTPGPATTVRLLLPGANRRIALKEFLVYGKPLGTRLDRTTLTITPSFTATAANIGLLNNGLLGMPLQSGFESEPKVTINLGAVVELDAVVVYNTESASTRSDLDAFRVSVTAADGICDDTCVREFSFTDPEKRPLYPTALQIPFGSGIRTSAIDITLRPARTDAVCRSRRSRSTAPYSRRRHHPCHQVCRRAHRLPVHHRSRHSPMCRHSHHLCLLRPAHRRPARRLQARHHPRHRRRLRLRRLRRPHRHRRLRRLRPRHPHPRRHRHRLPTRRLRHRIPPTTASTPGCSRRLPTLVRPSHCLVPSSRRTRG